MEAEIRELRVTAVSKRRFGGGALGVLNVFAMACALSLLATRAARVEARIEITPLLDGDVNIVAALRMHPESARALEHCRSLLTDEGIQLASALFFAVEKINKDPEMLPQLRLGVTIVDGSCDTSPSTMRDLVRYISGPRTNGLAWSFLPVINGLAASNPFHTTVRYALEALSIPQLFLESVGGGGLERGEMSLLPPRRTLAHAIFDLIRAYEMPEFVVVAVAPSDGGGGEDVWSGVLEELDANVRSYAHTTQPEHLCRRQVMRVPARSAASAAQARLVARHVASASPATVVLLLCNDDDVIDDVMAAALAANATERTWILSRRPGDELLARESFRRQDLIVVDDAGRTDATAAGHEMTEFLAFLSAAAQRSLSQAQRSDWVGLFVRQQRHWCIWAQNFTAAQMSRCQRVVSNPPAFAQHPLAEHAIDALSLVAAAVDGLLRLYCTLAAAVARPVSLPQPSARSPSPAVPAVATTPATCPLASFKPTSKLFLDAVRNATAQSVVGNETLAYRESFGSFRAPRFRISRKKPGSTAPVPLVVDWGVRSIIDNAIRRRISQSDVQQLRDACQPHCEPGSFRSVATTSSTEAGGVGAAVGQCTTGCSSCEPCPAGHYSNEENADECEPCAAGTTANGARTRCVGSRLDVLRWSDPRATAILVLAGVAMLALLLTAAAQLLRKQRRPGQPMDVGLCLLAAATAVVTLCVPFHVLYPSVGTCSLRFLLRHVAFTVFGLTLSLFSLSRPPPLRSASGDDDSDDGALRPWRRSLAYLVTLTTVTFIAALVCLVASPAAVGATLRASSSDGREQVLALACEHSAATMAIMVALGCVVCLAAVALAVSAWRSGESARLPIAAALSLVVWLTMNLVRHYSAGARHQLCDAILGLLLAAGTLALLLIPAAVSALTAGDERATEGLRRAGGRPMPQKRGAQQQSRPNVAASIRGKLSAQSMWRFGAQGRRGDSVGDQRRRGSQYENNLAAQQPGYMLCGYPNTHGESHCADYEFFHGVAGRHVKFTLDQEVRSLHDDQDDVIADPDHEDGYGDGGEEMPERPPTPPQFVEVEPSPPPPTYSNPPQPTPRLLVARKSKHPPPPPSDPPPD